MFVKSAILIQAKRIMNMKAGDLKGHIQIRGWMNIGDIPTDIYQQMYRLNYRKYGQMREVLVNGLKCDKQQIENGDSRLDQPVVAIVDSRTDKVYAWAMLAYPEGTQMMFWVHKSYRKRGFAFVLGMVLWKLMGYPNHVYINRYCAASSRLWLKLLCVIHLYNGCGPYTEITEDFIENVKSTITGLNYA